jgi:hypothetical protein
MCPEAGEVSFDLHIEVASNKDPGDIFEYTRVYIIGVLVLFQRSPHPESPVHLT